MESNGQHSKAQADWRTDADVFADVFASGMKRAVAAAIAEHHRAGNPVAIWQEGRVVMLYPDGTTRPVEEQPAP